MNVGRLGPVMAVRRRFMKAVFFFKEASRESLTGKMSAKCEYSWTHSVSGGGVPVSPAQAFALRSRNSPSDQRQYQP